MKYCSQCGASCKDEAMFCTSCGHKLNEGAPSSVVPPQQTASSEPNASPQQTAPTESNVQPQQTFPHQQGAPSNPKTPPHGYGYPGHYPGAMPPRPVASMTRTSLVEMLDSPVLLILTILLSGSVLFTFVSLCLGQWTVIFGLVPAALGIIGLWMLFNSVQGYHTRGIPISLSSFPLFKASNIASIVLNAVYTIIMDIFLIILLAELGGYRYYPGGGSLMAVLSLTLIFLTAFEVFAILYYIKGMQVITDIRIALETGQPVKPISKYFVIFSFIIGVCGVLGSIYVLVMASIANAEFGGGYLAGSVAAAALLLISSLSGSGFYISLGIFLSKLSGRNAYSSQR